MNSICNKYPKLIMVEITTKCNLLCDYCFKSKNNYNGKDMPWEVFNTIKDKVSSFEYVSFCGMGEQLLHKNFYDMVTALGSQKLLIITNGTIIIDYKRLLIKNNIHTITFSVDGPNEEISRKSCVKYNFDNLLTNLKEGLRYPHVVKGINFVLGSGNLGYALDMFEFCKEYGISSINFLLPSNNKRWILDNKDMISQVLEKAKELATSNNIRYSDPYNMHCIFENSVIPFITSTGFIRPCCDHENRIPMVGNILKNTFNNLWENDKYLKFKSGYYCTTCNMYK